MVAERRATNCRRCPAVLQLAGGPERPVEWPLATTEELKNLCALAAAGIIGFPGHDTEGWPSLGDKAAATYHDGVISRITDFRMNPSGPTEEQQFVQYTMATWPGFSGSPVFLANGHVVAIHNMGRPVRSPNGIVSRSLTACASTIYGNCLPITISTRWSSCR
jgi:hypothetical protein